MNDRQIVMRLSLVAIGLAMATISLWGHLINGWFLLP